MTCNEFSDRVSDFLDGEIAGDHRTAMKRHADGCPACAGTLRGLQSLTDRLHRLHRLQPSAEFDFALRSRLLLEMTDERRWWRQIQDLLFPSVPRAALASTAAVLILLGATTALKEDPIRQVSPVSGVRLTPGEAVPATPRGALKQLSHQETITIAGRSLQLRQDSSASAVPRRFGQSRYGQEVRRVAVRF